MRNQALRDAAIDKGFVGCQVFEGARTAHIDAVDEMPVACPWPASGNGREQTSTNVCLPGMHLFRVNLAGGAPKPATAQLPISVVQFDIKKPQMRELGVPGCGGLTLRIERLRVNWELGIIVQATAEKYLETLQRHEELHGWLSASMPRNAGGSDLIAGPPGFSEQLKAVDIEPKATFIESFREMMRRRDPAAMNFQPTVARLPNHIRSRLQLGNCLAVGTLNSCDFNGAVVKVPDSDAKAFVVVLPMGVMFLPTACADLLQIIVDETVLSGFIDAFYENNQYKQSFSDRWRRVKHFTHTRLAISRKFTLEEVAKQMQMQLHRYATLGVFDANDYIRDWLPIPVFPDPRIFGHPLEPGSAIGEFALRFLILQECGHLVQDKAGDSRSFHEVEYDADAFALQSAIDMSPTTAQRVATVVGAVFFLEVAHWIDQLTDIPSSATIHLSAPDRISRLECMAAGSDRLSRLERRLVMKTVAHVRERFDGLWHLSSSLREWQAKGNSSLVASLRTALAEAKPERFLDQEPRWLMFGAPDRLINELGKLRIQLERRTIELGEQHEEASHLVQRIYAIAESSTSSDLFDKLERAYCAHANH